MKYDRRNSARIETVIAVRGKKSGCLCLKGAFINEYWFSCLTKKQLK
jgi:hypothetical protein